MLVTFTAVQEVLQLLVSLPGAVSDMTPLGEGSKSAQARIYFVPDEVKVIDFTAGAVAPAPRAAMFGVTGYSVIVPPPFCRVDTWNLLAKATPVDVLPLLVIVKEKVTGLFTVTVAGVQVGADAVSSLKGSVLTTTCISSDAVAPPSTSAPAGRPSPGRNA